MQAEAQLLLRQVKVSVRDGRTRRPPFRFRLLSGPDRDPLEQVIRVCLIHGQIISP